MAIAILFGVAVGCATGFMLAFVVRYLFRRGFVCHRCQEEHTLMSEREYLQSNGRHAKS